MRCKIIIVCSTFMKTALCPCKQMVLALPGAGQSINIFLMWNVETAAGMRLK